MRLILLGAPGVGKGTHAVRLAERFKVPHLATGDMLRNAHSRSTPLGKRAEEFMRTGALVPDDIILRLMEEMLTDKSAEGGFILDGFPRTITQADGLDAVLTKLGHSIDAVINIEVEEDVIVRRLAARRTCQQCGHVYNLTGAAPKRKGICDRCGGQLVQRDDDLPKTVRRRLRVYAAQTTPLIEYYDARGLLRQVSGDGGIDTVYRRILERLGTLDIHRE